jgi:UDP-glucose 4-epimerase
LLLQQLKQLQGILFSSSVAVYGKPSYIPVDELCPIEPISFYGCGKFAAEKYLKLHSNDKDVPLTILRISTVYGQRDRSNQMIPVFMRKALCDESIDLYGSSSRDFIHISDVIKVIMSAIKLNQNNLFNIGTGKKFSNQFILKKIIEITKSESKITYLEKSTEYDFLCDNSKAIKYLDFNPMVSIEEGLVDEMLWYEKERDQVEC